MKIKYFILIFLVSYFATAQENNFTIEELTLNENIDGTLLVPNTIKKPDIAIIIPGSGPTDRNGNQNFLKNNSLKKLAEALVQNEIAQYRYDKRVVEQIK